MPSLANHHSNTFVKLLLLGDAKSGKTTSLASLIAAGYRLRILDFDNLLDTLAMRVRADCPERLDNVEYRSIRDAYKGTAAGTVIDGKPRAWIDSLKMLNRWAYDDIDLGVPAEWGPECVLVIDSLSRWCDSAYDFHEVMSPKGRSGDADGRAIYGNAQDDVEKQLANLTSPSFRTNVIVIAHGNYMAQADGTTKIFPQGVGQKLSPKIPQYFPNYIRMSKRGDKRTLQLKSDAMIDLANTRPDVLGDRELPADTGLAEFFAVLREPPAKPVEDSTPPRPKALTLRRV
jgi:AAA domain